MALKLERETKLEERSVAFVEARGGQALKLAPAGMRGFFDRTIIMPRERYLDSYDINWRSGRVWFAEFKRPKKGVISAQQDHWRKLLTGLGFAVYTIDNDADFERAWREMGGL